MKDVFRFGIIGCGDIAGHFAQAVESLDGAVIEAVAARDAGRARDFARRHAIRQYYGDYAQMLQNSTLDGVYVATVNSAHLESILIAVDAGLPVLCEKPMALSVSDFDRATRAAEQKGVALMEAMWSCFLPAYDKMREMIRDGQLGNIARADIHFSVPFPKNPASRIYSPALGGGLIYDIGVYNLHTAFTLFGENFRDLSVCGRKGPTGVDVGSVIAFSYDDGPLVCTTTADVAGPHELILCGDRGRLQADHFNGAQRLVLSQEGVPQQIIPCPFAGNGFEYEIQEFIAVVRSGRKESTLLPWSRSRLVCKMMEDAVHKICG